MKKGHIFSYLLETYHRAVEMIERRFKSEYDNSYKLIRKVIANYITLIMQAPENFELSLSKKDIIIELSKYFNETDEEEICFLFADVYQNTSSDFAFLANIFSFFFQIIHNQNVDSKPSLYNLEKIRKNLNLLTLLFEKCPLSAQVYVQEKSFIAPVQTGKQFQFSSHLSLYICVSTLEADINALKTNFASSKSQAEIEVITKSFNNKLNDYLNDVVQFLYTIYSVNDITRAALHHWVYQLINLNLERIKIYVNTEVTSSINFLLNTLIIALKIFYDQQNILKLSHSEFVFRVVSEIDPLFSVSNNRINFSKFDRINNDLAKEIVDNESDDQNKKEPLLNTELYFSIASLVSITIKFIDDEYARMTTKYDELVKANDPQR